MCNVEFKFHSMLSDFGPTDSCHQMSMLLTTYLIDSHIIPYDIENTWNGLAETWREWRDFRNNNIMMTNHYTGVVHSTLYGGYCLHNLDNAVLLVYFPWYYLPQSEYWKYSTGQKNGVDAFGYNSAESWTDLDEIWNRVSEMLGFNPGRFWALSEQ